MLRDLILRNRSTRRFVEEERIPLEMIKEWIDLARLSPSGRNLQPLRYIISNEPEKNAKIFPFVFWAAYLKGIWNGPVEGERPSAYIVILGDTRITQNFGVDHGIAAQSILLGAVEKGFAGCMIGSIDRDGLRTSLNIAPEYEILLVLALGRPAEKIILEPMPEDQSVKYWHDAEGNHHVPKRRLEDLLID